MTRAGSTTRLIDHRELAAPRRPPRRAAGAPTEAEPGDDPCGSGGGRVEGVTQQAAEDASRGRHGSRPAPRTNEHQSPRAGSAAAAGPRLLDRRRRRALDRTGEARRRRRGPRHRRGSRASADRRRSAAGAPSRAPPTTTTDRRGGTTTSEGAGDHERIVGARPLEAGLTAATRIASQTSGHPRPRGREPPDQRRRPRTTTSREDDGVQSAIHARSSGEAHDGPAPASAPRVPPTRDERGEGHAAAMTRPRHATAAGRRPPTHGPDQTVSGTEHPLRPPARRRPRRRSHHHRAGARAGAGRRARPPVAEDGRSCSSSTTESALRRSGQRSRPDQRPGRPPRRPQGRRGRGVPASIDATPARRRLRHDH